MRILFQEDGLTMMYLEEDIVRAGKYVRAVLLRKGYYARNDAGYWYRVDFHYATFHRIRFVGLIRQLEGLLDEEQHARERR